MVGSRRRLLVVSILVLMALSPLPVHGFATWGSSGEAPSASEGLAIADGPELLSVEHPQILFGVYPDAGNGQIGHVNSPEHDTVIESISALRSDRPFDVHLYTAWSWHNNVDLDTKINKYANAGLTITLTIKYSPPAGHDGDVKGYARFVRSIVRRYATNPAVARFVVGNEANVTWGDPNSSDGPFIDASRAVVEGVIAARQQLNRIGSVAQVGTSMAIIEPGHDAGFLQGLTAIGGREFVDAVSFIGINVYPGIWPVGSNDPYVDMVAHLRTTRWGMSSAGFGSGVSVAVLENGYPTADDALQAERLVPMVQAVCDVAVEVGVSSYSWFGLIDADSSSDNPYAHFGLLRSDLSKRPGFDRFQEMIASSCGS